MQGAFVSPGKLLQDKSRNWRQCGSNMLGMTLILQVWVIAAKPSLWIGNGNKTLAIQDTVSFSYPAPGQDKRLDM